MRKDSQQAAQFGLAAREALFQGWDGWAVFFARAAATAAFRAYPRLRGE